MQKYRHHDEDSSPQDQSSPQLTEEAGGPELVQVAEKNLSLIENVHGYVTHAHISPMKVGDGIVSASRLSHWSKRRLYWLLFQTVSEPQPSFQTSVTVRSLMSGASLCSVAAANKKLALSFSENLLLEVFNVMFLSPTVLLKRPG